jgi:hypothetical protein
VGSARKLVGRRGHFCISPVLKKTVRQTNGRSIRTAARAAAKSVNAGKREGRKRNYFYLFYLILIFAFCAAQRFRCASAIRLRASGLRKCFFLFFAEAEPDLRDEVNLVPLPTSESNDRTLVSRAISASI